VGSHRLLDDVAITRASGRVVETELVDLHSEGPRVRDLLRRMDGADDPTPRKALERARADVEAGAPWKARDRLQGLVRLWPADQQVLGMLGEVLFTMGDLPAAGRCWYLTERTGADVDAATAAMEHRHGRGALELTRVLSVVAPIHAYPPSVQVRLFALQDELKARGIKWSPPFSRPPRPRVPPPKLRRRDVVTITIGVVLLALVVGVWMVGFMTVLTGTDRAGAVGSVVIFAAVGGCAWGTVRAMKWWRGPCERRRRPPGGPAADSED
jgi:hypothetical protein